MYAAIATNDQRGEGARLLIDRPAVLRLGDMVEKIVLEDLTSGGCRFRCGVPLEQFAQVSIGIGGVGHTPAQIVWGGDGSYGCAFETPLPDEAVTADPPDNVARMVQAARLWQETALTEEPEITRWPLPARLAVVTGLTAFLWTGIIGAVRSML